MLDSSWAHWDSWEGFSRYSTVFPSSVFFFPKDWSWTIFLPLIAASAARETHAAFLLFCFSHSSLLSLSPRSRFSLRSFSCRLRSWRSFLIVSDDFDVSIPDAPNELSNYNRIMSSASALIFIASKWSFSAFICSCSFRVLHRAKKSPCLWLMMGTCWWRSDDGPIDDEWRKPPEEDLQNVIDCWLEERFPWWTKKLDWLDWTQTSNTWTWLNRWLFPHLSTWFLDLVLLHRLRRK